MNEASMGLIFSRQMLWESKHNHCADFTRKLLLFLA